MGPLGINGNQVGAHGNIALCVTEGSTRCHGGRAVAPLLLPWHEIDQDDRDSNS